MSEIIKQNQATTITLKLQVLSVLDDIPVRILETAINDCLNENMNILGIYFSKRS